MKNNNEEIRHKTKMEEIEFEFECKVKLEKIKHDLELERGRIKTAEIRKSQMRKYGDPYK